MLKKILLIDDDDTVNTINETLIRYASFAEYIVKETTVDGALKRLVTDIGNHSSPDMVFLDVNMPEKSGWDFLDEYSKLEIKKPPRLVMLTSSINPKDREKALANPLVLDFISKPITIELLNKISSDFLSSPR